MDERTVEEVKKTLAWFGGKCLEKLTKPGSKYAAKGTTWQIVEQETLVGMLRREVYELADAIECPQRPDDVVSEAVDVATLAMFIADNAHRRAE